ncbi:MAG: M20/M25/M40 family metallo-hydrolase [Bacteroidetes bacterium]|nr:MAG: M20/M25/M40 family metallo-hydrolase [Bacteroidota bacterium]
MRTSLLCCLVLLLLQAASAQRLNRIIKEKTVAKIEATLASDAMEGRATFSPGIDRAANYIAHYFKRNGIMPLDGNSHLQQFEMIKGQLTNATAMVGGQTLALENLQCISTKGSITVNQDSGYKIVRINKGENMLQIARPYLNGKQNVLILADTSFAPTFKQLRRFLGARFPQNNSVVVALTPLVAAETFSFNLTQQITVQKLANVVGVIEGKTKPNEYVVFSGHYDHLGYGKATADGDSLYNGANDDAAGTTAVMMLARYFKKMNNNARTLIFAAFTAEEIGGFGSRYFSEQLKPEQVMAMFNIEMIGTDSKWGNNSAYITGYEKTDMGKILERNLEGTDFKFYADPYPQQQLFYRSDNATLARLGVPAHTISTSKMDSEKYYHTADDEFGTLNMKNMTEIIKAIALSSRSIVMGTDTPTRVDVKQLR